MDELRKRLLHEIIGIYGPVQGQSIGTVIIPAFIGDFNKVLSSSEETGEITEEYMTEDKKIHLVLGGRKVPGAKGMRLEVDSCLFNDRELIEDDKVFMI